MHVIEKKHPLQKSYFDFERRTSRFPAPYQNMKSHRAILNTLYTKRTCSCIKYYDALHAWFGQYEVQLNRNNSAIDYKGKHECVKHFVHC
jgi:hypothetical protein